jgi:hypothetical protein
MYPLLHMLSHLLLPTPPYPLLPTLPQTLLPTPLHSPLRTPPHPLLLIRLPIPCYADLWSFIPVLGGLLLNCYFTSFYWWFSLIIITIFRIEEQWACERKGASSRHNCFEGKSFCSAWLPGHVKLLWQRAAERRPLLWLVISWWPATGSRAHQTSVCIPRDLKSFCSSPIGAQHVIGQVAIEQRWDAELAETAPVWWEASGRPAAARQRQQPRHNCPSMVPV